MDERDVLIPCGKNHLKTRQHFKKSRLFLIQLAYMTYLCVRGISKITIYQYLYYKTSLSLPSHENFTSGKSICDINITDPVFLEQQDAQKMTARLMMYFSIITGVTSLFSCLIWGSISDKIGRKMLFFLPNMGQLVMMSIYSSTSYWCLSLNILYTAYVIDGLCGTFVTVLIGAATSAADITNTLNGRTLLITAVDILIGVVFGLANISSGYMIQRIGYTVTFLVLAVLSVVNFATIFFMQETSPSSAETAIIIEHENVTRESKQQRSKITEILPYVKRTFQFYTKKTEKRRLYNISLVTFYLAAIVSVGRGGVETLYVVNRPFCWDSVKIGDVSGIQSLIQAVLTLFLLKAMQRCMGDAVIGAFAALTCVGAHIMEGLAVNDAEIYIAYALRLLALLLCSMARSISSKLTPRHLQGAVLSSLAAAETTVSLTAGVVFNGVYEATVTMCSGTVFFIMAVILFLCSLGYIALHVLMKTRDYTSMNPTICTIQEEPKDITTRRDSAQE